jgi:hypothetical protein
MLTKRRSSSAQATCSHTPLSTFELLKVQMLLKSIARTRPAAALPSLQLRLIANVHSKPIEDVVLQLARQVRAMQRHSK